jgi:Ca2+-binding EF-hand superfamily protein
VVEVSFSCPFVWSVCCTQASLLSPAHLSSLRTLFTRCDKTGSGSLSASQVAGLLRIATGGEGTRKGKGVSDLEVRDWLTEVDVGEEGGEGRCDFEEFVNLFTRSFEEQATEQAAEEQGTTQAGVYLTQSELLSLKSLFRSLDLDSDQLLSASDLQSAFASIGDEYEIKEVEQMIREVDSTKQGKVKLADFLAAMSPA